MADLERAYEILSIDQGARRSMLLMPTGLAVWLAGEKVMLGEPQQELINACLYYVRKKGLLETALAEFHADRAIAERKPSKAPRGKAGD